MEQKIQNNSSDEIIDFDDEYSEEENDKVQDLVEEPIMNKNQQIQNEKVQALSIEDEVQNENIIDDDNEITDPKVKELNEIDINNKQAIIDILMNDDLITRKPLKNEELIKAKNKNKFSYVRSTLNKINNSNEKETLDKNFYDKINTSGGNPEFVKDINVAANLLKNQIVEENEDVAKLLFDDINKAKNSKKVITGKEIGDKVKKALEAKKKNLEKIEQKIYEEHKSNETFTPIINHRKQDGTRRNLNSFLESQNRFLKNVEDKKQKLINKTESVIKELNAGKPKLNKNSEKIAEKISGNQPAYMRLYNKRGANQKIKEEVEEKLILKEKEEEQKRKERENELKKNDPYKHVKSKINIFNNQLKPVENNNINHTQSQSPKKLNRGKSAVNITRHNNLINNPKKKYDYKYIQSNKILYNKFISHFDEVLISLGEEESNNQENNLEELNNYLYHKLLYNLGMVTSPPENKPKKEEQDNKENELIAESSLKLEEVKLVNDSFNLLKLNENNAKVIDIKNFLICILDFTNYNLYLMFKASHEQDLKDIFPQDKYKKDDIPELIFNKQNEELISQVDKANKLNNRYFSVSLNNKLIFTLDKSANIKKDFSLFSLNYRNQKKKNNDDKLLNYIKQQCPFKPEINEKSNKIYQKYKDKVFAIQNETVTSNSNSQLKKGNMEYIDRILLLDKKRIAETQKIKEEIEKKQIKECTFKPRINQYQLVKKGKKEENKNSNNKKEENKDKDIKNKRNVKGKNKFEELYEEGRNKIKNKIYKTREEIELEEQKSECTFQPNIKGLNPKKIPKTNFTNDIYNEKEYKILYERLKHGRLERMVKDSNNNRYGLNDELKQFVKDNKEYNFIQNQQYFDPDDPYYYNSIEMNNMMNKLNDQIEQNNNEKIENDNNGNIKSQEINKEKISNKELDSNIDINNANKDENLNNNLIIEKSNKTAEENISEEDEDKEKKEEIPLLIIDVNIRQGVKRKIYVYEGDTPEVLSEKFAKEHNLDIETKNKLQSLIHSHMQRLLTRIEEENQSNSEKSQNVHNQKSN